jgi:peptide/nickel transport system substrate-binding protein
MASRPGTSRRLNRLGNTRSLLLAILLGILAACGAAPAAPPPTAAPATDPTAAPAATVAPTEAPTAEAAATAVPEPTAAPAAEESNKTATIGMVELVTSLDPPTDWAIAATWIHMNIFDCLVWRNRDTTEFEPWLASSYENIDPTTWRFKLREGVTFHNGEPFNADAVVWTYQRILDDDTMITYPQWTFIKEMKVVDPMTVDFITTAPEPAMLSKISGTGCGIQAPVAGKAQQESGAEYAPIGTGPFVFSEWVKDDYIKLTANPDYWQGKPDIETLLFRAIPETSTRVASLIAGDIDLTVGVPKQDWERVNGNEGTSVVEYLTNRTLLLALRTAPSGGMPDWTGPTSDPLVRQAISLAIDRATLIELIDGMGVPTLSRITPPTLGWTDKYFDQLGEYNPDKARELLAQSSYNGEPLTFHTSTAFLYQKEVAEAITAMLQDVGLTVDLQVMDVTSFREQVYFPNKNEEIYMDALGNSFFDPWITVREFAVGQKQRSGWVNADVEKLIDEAGVNMDPEARAAQYVQIQDLIIQDNPHVYLYLMKDAMGKSDRLEFTMNPDNFLWMGFAKVK